jgi:hypothetical protein
MNQSPGQPEYYKRASCRRKVFPALGASSRRRGILAAVSPEPLVLQLDSFDTFRIAVP